MKERHVNVDENFKTRTESKVVLSINVIVFTYQTIVKFWDGSFFGHISPYDRSSQK